jgi:hypothetical protein
MNMLFSMRAVCWRRWVEYAMKLRTKRLDALHERCGRDVRILSGIVPVIAIGGPHGDGLRHPADEEAIRVGGGHVSGRVEGTLHVGSELGAIR